MNIILEGCDGVGKSTLAEALAHRIGADVVHLTRYSPCDVKSCMSRIVSNVPYVMDRSYISELVYSKVFNRACVLSEADVEDLRYNSALHNVLEIILVCDKDELHRRLVERNNEGPEIMDNVLRIQDAYVRYASENGVLIVSVDNMTTEELTDKIINIYKENYKEA